MLSPSSLVVRILAPISLVLLACQGRAADLPAAERDAFEAARLAPRPVAIPGGGCTFPAWTPSMPYAAMSIVTYGSAPYFAKYDNPGYNPTISTYFWGAYSCPASTVPLCTYGDWMRDWPYAAGSIVAHEGNLLIAEQF